MLSIPADLLSPFYAFDFSHSPVVVAVSGGSDSTALLILLNHFLKSEFPMTELLAVTVDHGLRTGSDAEANAVAALSKRIGVGHRTIEWSGAKPGTGLPAAAREARYRLLARIARGIGAQTIVTGHTANDQAETVAMRRSRAPGLGLAGMAPATPFDNAVWIVRPLLATRRAALCEFLASRQIGWAEDLTNTDHSFERARVRQQLGTMTESPGRIDTLLALARRVAGQRRELGEQSASLIERHASQPTSGLIHLQPDFLRAQPLEVAVHALRVLLSVVGGSNHLVDERRSNAMLARLADPPHRETLSRSMVASRRDGIWLCREQRGLPRAQGAVDGMIWDRRHRLARDENCAGVVIQPAGDDAALTLSHPAWPASLARMARFCQPMFYADAGGTCRPSKGKGHFQFQEQLAIGWSAKPILAPWAAFLSSFDLAPAIAVARLIGAPQPPRPPFAHHIVTPP